MTKVYKFLGDKGGEISHLETHRYRRQAGRSFYNDGTYSQSVYYVTLGESNFYLVVKDSGRWMARISLTKNGYEKIELYFSQKALIEGIRKEFLDDTTY